MSLASARETPRRLVAIVSFIITTTACGGTGAPTPTPGDLTALRSALTRHGLMTISAVSGESACPGSLTDNAFHMSVSLGEGEARDLFIYLFRAREFEATAAEMEACTSAYARANAGAPVSRIDRAPYRALGAGWSQELYAAVDAALRDTVGGG